MCVWCVCAVRACVKCGRVRATSLYVWVGWSERSRIGKHASSSKSSRKQQYCRVGSKQQRQASLGLSVRVRVCACLSPSLFSVYPVSIFISACLDQQLPG